MALLNRYPSDPNFPNANMTHAWVWQAAAQGDIRTAWHEFRKAKQDRWAEWVDARTPYGEDARKMVDWMERSQSKADRAEFEAKQKELCALAIKIDQYFFPPDTRPEATQNRELALKAIFSQEMLAFLAAIGCTVAFWVTSSEWPIFGRLIALPFIAVACYQALLQLTGWFVPPRAHTLQRIPGFDKRSLDVSMGDVKLSDLLRQAAMSSSDEVLACFGDWRNFREKQGLTTQGLRNVYEILFLDARTGKEERWNVGRKAPAIPEGEAVLFLYRLNSRSGTNDVPLGVLNLKTWDAEIFQLFSMPYQRQSFWYGLLGIPAGALLVLLASPSNFNLYLHGGFVVFAVFGCTVAFLALGNSFDQKRRRVILGLPLRVEYKLALHAEYVRLKFGNAARPSGGDLFNAPE
jgi:hypothetical protein